MYAGVVMEQGTVGDLFDDPFHPYAQGLLGSIAHRHSCGAALKTIPGIVPNLLRFPTGCRFRDTYPAAHAPSHPCTNYPTASAMCVSRDRIILKGDLLELADLPGGCQFQSRCAHVSDKCGEPPNRRWTRFHPGIWSGAGSLLIFTEAEALIDVQGGPP